MLRGRGVRRVHFGKATCLEATRERRRFAVLSSVAPKDMFRSVEGPR